MLKRFAIAAIFTGIGIAVWMMLPKTHEQGQIVQAQPEKKPTNPVQQIDSSVNHQVPDNNNAQQSTIALTGEKEKQKVQDIAPVVKQQNKPLPVAVQQTQPNDQSTVAAIDNHDVQNKNTAIDISIGTVAANTDHNSGSTDNNANTNEQQQKDIYAYQNTHSDFSSANDSYAKPAVYKEINPNEDANSNTLYIGSIGLNKNKVRGIMKKVGGIFSGKTKNAAEGENGKLQVANFELNTN